MNSQSVIELLTEKITHLRIAVIGDVMLDRYAYGEVRRISPEAPVPVTRVKRLTSVLGGAGNVAANLAGLGVQVYVAGMTGEDDHRRVLEKKLRELGVDYSGLIASPKRSTITKMRIIGARQQMLRLDFEEPGDLLPDEEQALLQWLRKHLDEGLDGIVLSDYAKGTCSDRFCQMVITQARAAHVPVLVDPKGSDWAKYRGCDLITPNVKEMCEAAGKIVPNVTPALVELAQQARETFDIRYVVVTRSEKGVTLVGKDDVITKAATAQEVFDVSGAGDTVASVLLAAISGKLSLADALELSNKAAGIVVSKVGTYPVHKEELLREILADSQPDDSVRRLKGQTRPFNHETDRARLLASLRDVDAVALFGEDTPTELIKKIRPDILVKGGDYKKEEVAGREYARTVEILPFKEGYSTTGLVEKIVTLVKEGKL